MIYEYIYIYDIKKYEEEGGRREVVGMFIRCKYSMCITLNNLNHIMHRPTRTLTELNKQYQKLQMSLTDFGKPSAKIKTYYTKIPRLAISYLYVFSFRANPTLALTIVNALAKHAAPSLIPIRIP